MSCYEILDIVVNIIIGIITLGGIIGTIIHTSKNTNLQINNQNKQSYRPYIRIEKIDAITNNEPEDNFVNMFDQYYNDIHKYIEVKSKLMLKDGNYTINNSSSCSIAINENTEVKVIIKYIREEKEMSDSVNYVVFYEDINGNIYSNEFKIEIGIDGKGTIKLFYKNINSYDHGNKRIYRIDKNNNELSEYIKTKKLKE